jgi:uncharacterized protein (TIGR02246 family)
MPLIKAEVLKYLSDMRADYSAYHNHKEVSAWAGVALYVIIISQLFFAKDDLLREPLILMAASVLLALLFVATIIYLKTQFYLRREAANYNGACIALSAEVLTKADEDIKEDDYLLESKVKDDAGHHSPHILPKLITKKADELRTVGQKLQNRLVCAAFAIILLTSIAAAFRLLVTYLDGRTARSEQVLQVVEAGNRAFIAAFLRGDSQAVAALYTEDGKIIAPGNEIASGRLAIAAFWSTVIGSGVKELSLDTAEVESVGDLAYEVGTVRLVGPDSQVTEGRYVAVWKQKNGQWKLHRDIWNSALRPELRASSNTTIDRNAKRQRGSLPRR